MTLPTRPDGGIDWEKIIFPDAAYMTYGWVHKNNEIKRVSMYDFNRLVAAHERERSARTVIEAFPNQYGLDAAAAIRKMED